MNRHLSKMNSVSDAQYFAGRRLPRAIMQQMENGAGVYQTHDANIRALREVMFRPRHGIRIEERNQSVTVLGHRLKTPLIASSIGGLAIAHRDAEIGVARAMKRVGGMQFVSGVATTPIEQVVEAAGGPVFFQLYYSRSGQAGMVEAIKRAKSAGAAGLVFCIDSVLGHTPIRQIPADDRRFLPRSKSVADAWRFLPQLATRPAWTVDFLRSGMGLEAPMSTGLDGRALSFAAAAEAAYSRWLDWEDLTWIRDAWDCPIIVKGVLSAAEARKALNHGAAAVVVSNHGGNRLDGTLPSLSALPEVVDAVGDQMEVLFDSGIRTGTDVVKAIALGAKAVGLGRAYLYPLAAGGEAGVIRILEVLRRDIDRTMAYVGCSALDQLSTDHLAMPPHSWRS